jgi:hypothetical protein
VSKEETLKEKVQKFYRDHPLYTPFDIDVPDDIRDMRPEILVLDCIYCRVERPFSVFIPGNKPVYTIPFPVGYDDYGRRGGVDKHETDPEPFHYEFQYVCTHCNALYYYAFQVSRKDNRVFKIGQFPPPSEKLDPLVERELGPLDAQLFKKGLRNLNYAYGIGACAYMRRLVEDQIVSILLLLKGQTQDPERLSVIEEALQAKDFTRKTHVAKDFAPDSLKVGDMNVLKVIHDEYSKGMHGYTDEQCLEIALKLRVALEFVLVELKAHEKKRRAFVETMKGIQNPKGK